MKHRPLIWYSPGMVSLVLLPVLCLNYMQSLGCFEKQNLLPVFRITKEFYEPPRKSGIVFVRPPDRSNLEIVLDGNDKDAKTRLDFAQRYVNQIVAGSDTAKGILFRFTGQAKYWMFVRALDICKTAKIQHFVTMENNVQAYYEVPEDINFIIFLIPFCDVIIDKKAVQQAELQARKEQFKVFAYTLWPVALTFCLLVFCSGLRLVKHELYGLKNYQLRNALNNNTS